jgi:anti-sigma factor (TIGR02949 family)
MARSGERKLKNVRCDEVLEQLSEFIDEETRAELCEEIRVHLAQCEDCRIEVDTVKKTIMLFQKKGLPIEIPVTIGAKLEAALSREYGGSREPRSD